ncbi:MAG: PQQ-dependent sugar dehydrogenase, partial [Parvularculaceae bacterium]|nr:PQQ-dependent sugar dehydrogenase [Parvularculaceae bacterium]
MSSVAFHPDHATNGLLYVVTGEAIPNGKTPHYSAPQDETPNAFDNVLYEFRVSAGDPDQVDPASKRELLRVRRPSGSHTMSDLVFGGDGFLYVSLGDGGLTPTGTPTGFYANGQDTSNPFGCVLRLDVDAIGPNGRYAIPPDNPFAGGVGGIPELFAWGLRNPW